MLQKATARPQALAPLTLLRWTALLLVGLKLALLVTSSTFMDEAYYWLWGQHPALSYYDHPPLNAWLQGLAGDLFGWNRFALRVMVAAALAADIGMLWLFAKKLGGTEWQNLFWPTLVLFLATPVYFAVTAVALPDHLLLPLLLAALYFLHSFLDGWADRPRAAYRELYFGAAALGLAALAKYNAAFLGLGLALFIVASPRYRPLLKKPQLYIAAAITLLLQAPVLLWNLQHSLASFGFILGGRHTGMHLSLTDFAGFFVNMVLYVGPFLLLPMLSVLFSPRPGASPADGLIRMTFALSSLAILGLAAFSDTLFHWNLVAYTVALPLLVYHLRTPILFWAQTIYGAVLLGAVLINYTILPILNVSGIKDEASAWLYGWDTTAAAVREATQAHEPGFIAASDYTTASLLAFALGAKDVVSLSPRRDQFDYWFAPAAHAGEDAILFGDSWRPLPEEVKLRFETVVLLDSLDIKRVGKIIDTHRIYLGKGYIPPAETN